MAQDRGTENAGFQSRRRSHIEQIGTRTAIPRGAQTKDVYLLHSGSQWRSYLLVIIAGLVVIIKRAIVRSGQPQSPKRSNLEDAPTVALVPEHQTWASDQC